ncbi:MAG: glycosyltransferase family 2 protein [Acidiferrobacter thiooxydans]|jgi:glycosyltransferase involved in cell wall biosynthesis|uniref:glycosyltransferase family 2 protein n=1 Tax=Acidiferrobacter sp. SPIII_3 TaxID=1281578 RepID=UPI000D72C29B|nr:glycosyltransferase family 2 protein [Acidiferrobacter sp. SPIII_3]AWP21984.1 glycosyl transferase [Acidiferrobacter sp. SPIII_3]MDA8190046.1 glycosyltransferase family 2 protein [Gammaproteobacteria bacterium]
MKSRAPIAVLIPCYNEGSSIGSVISDFRKALPHAQIFVYDNNSTDDTSQVARAAGATVREEPQQGKGHVVRRMFRDIDASFYVLVDGDNTYDAHVAPKMLEIAVRGPYDLVNCVRRDKDPAAYRLGHRFGNVFLTTIVRWMFGDGIRDMLSGYKILSRRFVKSFPALADGFDIETEIAVHALGLSMPIAHIEGRYRGRHLGSQSKLRTYRDGFRILWLISVLAKHERPMLFFSFFAAILASFSLALGLPVVLHYLATGRVPRFPTAILAMGVMLLASLSLTTGIILDTVTRGRREAKMLIYLQQDPPMALRESLPQTTET